MAYTQLLALAAFVQTLNLSEVCRGRETILPKKEQAAAYDDCMRAEQAALHDLRQKWAQFPASARQPCASLAPLFESYVETLTCIEIRAGGGSATATSN